MSEVLLGKGFTHRPFFLLMFYITCLLLTVSLANRLTLVGGFLEPGGIYVFPLSFIICDIVGEVYGYSFPRLFIWIGAFSEIFFALVATLVSHMPAPDYFFRTEAYTTVFDPSLRFVFSSLLGTILGEFINIYLLSKWKIALSGRFFMLRSFASTAVGQAVLSIVVDILAFAGDIQWAHLIWMIFSGYFWKMAYSLLFIFPAWIVINYLKKVEHINHFDINASFNPFRLSLDR